MNEKEQEVKLEDRVRTGDLWDNQKVNHWIARLSSNLPLPLTQTISTRSNYNL